LSSRRDEIVSIARGIFASRGFKNTSMRDIADACGLLAGSLYSHFRSKSEILQLILDPFYDQLIPAQEEAAALSGTGAERTEEMLRRVCRVLVDNNEEMTIIHYDWQDLLGVEEFADIRDRSNYALELWHQVIVAGIGDGTLRAGVDPEVSVRVITSSLHGVLDRKRYGARPNPLVEDGLDSLIDEIVLMMLAGLASSPDRAPRRSAAAQPKRAARPGGPSSAKSAR
jgi:AcrR family transcriptional regulator